MRTTILGLFALTLTLALAGCGGAGWADGYYVGSENGQHFGDDSWMHDEFWYKAGALARFPHSDEGSFVAAGDETVAFQPLPSGALIVRGTPVGAITLGADGSVSEHGTPRGYVIYALRADGRIGTDLVDRDGRALGIALEDGAPRLVAIDAIVTPAPAERIPGALPGLPLAAPAE
jgi:hypothetical protein